MHDNFLTLSSLLFWILVTGTCMRLRGTYSGHGHQALRLACPGGDLRSYKDVLLYRLPISVSEAVQLIPSCING